MMHSVHVIVYSMILTIILCHTAQAQTPIQVYYAERIPYAISDQKGGIEGLTASPVARAFQTANIPFEWKKMPFKRQLITIKANKKKACGIGWFKNPERKEFARFSDAIYQDRPTIIIARKGNIAFDGHHTIKDLFKDNSIKLLVKDGFSYGKYLDELIEKEQPSKILVVGSSNLEMLQIILSGRADYFFAAEEEAEQMITSAGLSTSQFDLLSLNDMPAGNARYLACSKQVPTKIIEQFNQALRETK